MADTLSWTSVRSTSLVGYRIERAPSSSGPWTTLVTRMTAVSYVAKVRAPAVAYYRVRSVDKRGLAGSPSAPVANSILSMARVVTSSGATLRASNGALTLVLQPGTFMSATRVNVRDARAPGSPSVVRVTGSYDFSASGALLKPARVTVPYRVPVTHFQVAGTVARGIDWMSWSESTSSWVPVTTSVDTTASTITAEMPHFSYWTGAFIQPHGTTVAKTTYCATICHGLSAAPGSPVVLANNDTQVCYNCHGNPDPLGSPLGVGTVGAPNIQASFYACSGQSLPVGGSMHPVRAPGGTTGLTCTACHDPHKDPATAPNLLRAYDAVTGKAIASSGGTTPGSAYCWSCHGVRKNVRAELDVPGYYARTGNKKTNLVGTAHDVMDIAGVGKGCSGCHGGHSATTGAIVRSTIGGTVVTDAGRSLCRACHGLAAGTFPGEAVFASTGHGKTTGLNGQALVRWPGRSDGGAGDCANCHDPHGTGNADYTRASGSALCKTCHDDASVTYPANTSYRGAAAYTASVHGGTECAKCHAVHGASDGVGTAPKLVAGRQDAACIPCHSAGSGNSGTAGTAPRTWNGRDLAVEFARASHHPVDSGPGTMTATPEPVAVLGQHAFAEFDTGTAVGTDITPDDGVKLAWGPTTFTRAARDVVYAEWGTWRLDAYDIDNGSWNTLYDPADLTGVTGMTQDMIQVGGRLYASQSDPWLWDLTLSDGLSAETWHSHSATSYGGLSLDRDIAHGSMYLLQGNNYGLLRRWSIASDSQSPAMLLKDGGGNTLNIGGGAAGAYAPTLDRFYLSNINRYASYGGGDGRLVFVQSPSTKSGDTPVTDTGFQVTNSALVPMYSSPTALRMRCVTLGGADYLFVLGQNAAGTNTFRVLGDLQNGSPTERTLSWPWSVGVGWVTYNMSMTTDGTYIYASRGGIYDGSDYGTLQPMAWSRIRIPGNPLVDNWPAWEALPTPTNRGANITGDFGAIAWANVTPPPIDVDGYCMSGTYTTPDILAPADATTWAQATWIVDTPAYTSADAKVEGYSAGAWQVLPGMDAVSGGSADLSAFSTSQYSRLRVTFALSTVDYNSSPVLRDVEVTAMRRGRLYVATSEERPSIGWLGVHPVTTFDTFTRFSAAATLTAGPMVVPPFKQRLLWMQLDREVPTYLASTNLWKDPTIGFAVPDLDSRWDSVSYLSGLYQQDDRVFLTHARQNGLPAFQYIAPTAGASWTYIDGTGLGLSYTNNRTNRGWASPSLHGIWVASLNSVASRYEYYKIDTLSRTRGTTASWFVQAGTGLQLHTGDAGAIEYSELTDTLLIIDRGWAISGSSAGTGRLWRVSGAAAKLAAGGAIEAVDSGLVMTAAAPTNVYGSADLVTKGGREYLCYYRADLTQGYHPLVVVADPGTASPVLVDTGRTLYPTSPTYAQQLVWDGGDYLYFHLGGGGRRFHRIRIPADPVAGPWSAWEDLGWVPVTLGMDNGSFWGAGNNALAVGSVDTTVGPLEMMGYQTATRASGAITVGDTTEWGWLSWTAAKPTGTDVAMTVQRWTGSAWQDVPGLTGLTTSPVDLGALSRVDYPQLQVVATLSTADPFAAPSVAGWTVTSGTDRMRLMSDQVAPAPGATSWGKFTNDTLRPAGADVTFTVRGWNGSAFVDIPGFTGLRDATVDLGSIRIADWPRLQLDAWMSKSTPTDPDPSVDAWAVTSLGATPSSRGSVTCGSCHDAHTVAEGGTSVWDFARFSDPADTKRTYSSLSNVDVTSFCLTCHTDSVPAPGSASASVPATLTWSLPSDRPLLTSWSKTSQGADFRSSGHYTGVNGSVGCENCHDPHGSDNDALTAWTLPGWFAGGLAGARDNTSDAAYEQNLCYQCHGNGVIGRTAPGALDVATPASSASAHPIGTDGRHSDEERLSDLGIGNRHSECVDCHDPHAARVDLHVQGTSRPGPVLLGAVGTKPAWPAAIGVAATSFERVRFSGASTDREAYLCFKCHSSATTLTDGNGAGATDLTVAFNPNNQSYHNVLGLSKGVRESFTIAGNTYTWGWAGSLTGTWNQDSGMTCSDCHTGGSIDQAKGPHGSSVQHVIDPAYPTDWRTAQINFSNPNGMSPGDIICAKCHDLNPSTNNVHSVNKWYGGLAHGPGARCTSCHVAIPHGWKRPRLIAYASDPAPYAAQGAAYSVGIPEITGMRVGNKSPQGWLKSDCTGCSNYAHPGSMGAALWP